ncbi:radiation-inducible immediate-early gene IEX-1 [Trichomycterus rosablanca]|uniref:radiation-inducible immediate-early gene IEX-1 n=1 Tax=Trichomycterus rosablanca TaxID=2290929 RepID=UPI002F352DD8
MYTSRYTRPSTMSFTFPEHVPAPRRNTQPEVFTFDALPEQQQRTSPPRQRRRIGRVLYPANVRRYLPPAEKSPAKRLLLALCLLLLAQIYTERADEELHETGAEPGAAAATLIPGALALPEPGDASAHAPALFLSFQSAEKGCSTWTNRTQNIQQSVRNNGYVVALLYPVYHTLGTEQ